MSSDELRLMSEEAMAQVRKEVEEENTQLAVLEARLKDACIKLFGDPVTIHRNFAIARDEWEFTILTRLFGRRARFDCSIPADDIFEKYALEAMMHDLAYQIMDQHEEDLLHGYGAYFDVDRQYTTGIIRHGEPYKLDKWRYPQREDGGNNLDDKIGGLYEHTTRKDRKCSRCGN